MYVPERVARSSRYIFLFENQADPALHKSAEQFEPAFAYWGFSDGLQPGNAQVPVHQYIFSCHNLVLDADLDQCTEHIAVVGDGVIDRFADHLRGEEVNYF